MSKGKRIKVQRKIKKAAPKPINISITEASTAANKPQQVGALTAEQALQILKLAAEAANIPLQGHVQVQKAYDFLLNHLKK